jgi:hypothetical protein
VTLTIIGLVCAGVLLEALGIYLGWKEVRSRVQRLREFEAGRLPFQTSFGFGGGMAGPDWGPPAEATTEQRLAALEERLKSQDGYYERSLKALDQQLSATLGAKVEDVERNVTARQDALRGLLVDVTRANRSTYGAFRLLILGLELCQGSWTVVGWFAGQAAVRSW